MYNLEEIKCRSRSESSSRKPMKRKSMGKTLENFSVQHFTTMLHNSSTKNNYNPRGAKRKNLIPDNTNDQRLYSLCIIPYHSGETAALNRISNDCQLKGIIAKSFFLFSIKGCFYLTHKCILLIIQSLSS